MMDSSPEQSLKQDMNGHANGYANGHTTHPKPHHASDLADTDKVQLNGSPKQPNSLLTNGHLGPRSNHDASYSATPPRRSKKNTPPRNNARLGAIDEHTSIIAPDVPSRHPNRKHHKSSSAAKFFTFGTYSRSDNSLPPVDAYDKIVGPRGEKFNDVRQNRPFRTDTQRSRRRPVCLAVIILAILLAIGLGVGLGVGLTRNKRASSTDITSPGDSDSSTDDPAPFPIGTWSIPTYLMTVATSCTSQSSTWRCYPYSTFTSSNPSTSFSTLSWRISSPTNSSTDLRISSTNPTFSYPFIDVPLILMNSNDARLSAYSFDFNYRKQVVPNADITGDGGATRCYYNNTLLTVRMYSTAEGAGGEIEANDTSASTGSQQNWPFAIEYEERIGTGPECFRYVNGSETESVAVGSGNGDCLCDYRNYGLS